MSSKKNWCSPQLYSLNLNQTKVEIDTTTPSGLGVDFTANYEAPVDIADTSSSSSSGSADYYFGSVS
ncbi:hypothetical protein [Cellulosilyticum ruminicola]|uniref:hypothetical protein n=1 Tax=Cellulosilyticum ruminicola TaxID=425254 RepID=UPI0006D0F533|nr:hypothetical protein [Cellulosilyticum ruminicola]